ncbi:branched-chain amino acid ABC transporter permease [Calidifontibacillus oryziterrae]|uniref:branched-chain amino acid ABC transporter permease n=1 Tax=Calidifontibacillus oryziterrae TaxID=1191699 RepID=UPI0002D3C94F|nr:branched-chain amino acid ABC transporter permease [Calidifontibacillus oryziterrae]
MDVLAIQLVNGLSYGFLLFIITSGLSLVFGIMGVLNLAHGSMYMLGAYIALSLLTKVIENFWVAILLASVLVALVALVIEVGLLRPTYHLGHLSQVLLTFGLAYVFHDIAKLVWGTQVMSLPLPDYLQGSIQLFGQTFPIYRLTVIAIGVVVGLGLWFLQEKTRYGAIIRAGLVDKEMVSGLGINIKLVFTCVFLFGGVLAGFGGGIAAPILGIYPSMEFQTLILALVVLVIGGLGSFLGTFIASLLVGLLETFSKYFFPEVSLFIIFALMAIVLVVKPNGLLGKKVV